METVRSADERASKAWQHPEVSQCPLAIMRNADSEILAFGSQDQFTLPSCDLPARKRPAPILLATIHAVLGLDAICRYSLSINPSELCFVLDLIDPDQPLSGDQFWLPVKNIRWDSVAPPVRDTLWSVLARNNTYASGKLAGHFVSHGWLGPIQAWTQAALAPEGLHLTGAVGQYNIGPDFALLRFATSGRAVWFKAVGHPNCHEFAITRELSNFGLPHVPELIAVDESLQAWLMYEAAGTFPGSCYSREQWKWLARSLAELQLASLPFVPALASVGCCDLTIHRLEQRIDSYLLETAGLMRLQTAEPPLRLTSENLRLMERSLRTACRRMERLAVPDSIGHSDFNAGNILVRRGKVVFLDWAQGHLGPPCLTFEYLRLLVARSCPADDALMHEIRHEYLRVWASSAAGRDIAECLDLGPLLAVFAYAVVCHTAAGDFRSANAESIGFLRSLARRIYREAQASAEGREPDHNKCADHCAGLPASSF